MAKLDEEEKDKTNLYLKNIPTDFTESDLDTVFSKFGDVKSTKILRDEAGDSRGVGFCRMATHEMCERILSKYHQTGLIESMTAQYARKKTRDSLISSKEPEDPTELFLGNLPKIVTENALSEKFSGFGKIQSIKVMKSPDGSSRGFGFCRMSSKEECDNIIELFNDSHYDLSDDSKPLIVKYATGSKRKTMNREKTLYISKLPDDFDESKLTDMMSPFGKVMSTSILRDKISGKSRGVGFCCMETKEECHNAIELLQESSLEGSTKPLEVKFVEPKQRKKKVQPTIPTRSISLPAIINQELSDWSDDDYWSDEITWEDSGHETWLDRLRMSAPAGDSGFSSAPIDTSYETQSLQLQLQYVASSSSDVDDDDDNEDSDTCKGTSKIEVLFHEKKHVVEHHVDNYELLSYMKKQKMLTQGEEELLLLFEPDSVSDMLSEMLIDMKRVKEDFYWKFLRSLRKTGHEHVVPMIEGPGLLFVELVNKQSDVTKPISKKIYNQAKNLTKKTKRESSLIRILENLSVEVVGVYCGSVILVLKIPDTKALEKVWEMCKSGMLKILVNIELTDKDDLPEGNLAVEIEDKDSPEGELTVEIEDKDYQICKAELSHLEAIAYPGWQDALDKIATNLPENIFSRMVLESMWSNGAVTRDECNDILLLAQSDKKKKLTSILKKSSWAFVKFVETLDDTGNGHYSNLLRPNEPGAKPMSDEHRKILRDNHIKLAREITLDDLLEHLQQRNDEEGEVLLEYDIERIEAERVRTHKAFLLLLILRDKRDECYMLFVRALCQTSQCHLAKLLVPQCQCESNNFIQ